MTTHEQFVNAWTKLTQIPFNVEWKNTTGYLDFVCEDDTLNLEPGQMVGCTDDLNRKMIIKGLGNGLNMVVFERGVRNVLVSNTPSARILRNTDIVIPLGFESSITQGTLEAFLGLKDYTVTFYKDSAKIKQMIKDKVEDTQVQTQLLEAIESDTSIQVTLLEQHGINVHEFLVTLEIGSVNK